MTAPRHDAIVIGGGMFGSTVALHLQARGARVLLVEREADILRRASYANQARVHNGYHYPRSVLTALRSRFNAPRFLEAYADCVDESATAIYAIGRSFSKVNAAQFRAFCLRVGARLERPPERIRRMFNPVFVEEVFVAQEAVFDAVRLAQRLRNEMDRAGLDLALESEVTRIAPARTPGMLHVSWRGPAGSGSATAREVFNCTYSGLNAVLSDSGLPLLPLRHEFTELALVETPGELRELGITIMDGPFWSLLPFPALGLHTLSHVRYTPHCGWEDRPGEPYDNARERWAGLPRRTRYPHMMHDAQRYVPALRDCRYRDSIWEVKTVLPSSDVDDSRPILFHRHHGLPNLTSVLGAKIDNIFDVLAELDAARGEAARS